jgi:Ca-activated chloride channel family protein
VNRSRRDGSRGGPGRAILLAAVCLSALALAGASLPAQTTFRADAQTVPVYATVLDRAGRLVTDLTRADFQVLDNGKPVPLTVFSNSLQPITVALMLDVSDSIEIRAPRVRDSARHFVNAMLPADRVKIGSFGEEVAVSPLLTGNKADLLRIIDEELWSGGGTPLWSALDAAMTALDGINDRRVVVALTDGRNACVQLRGPCQRFEPAERRALDEGFMIYAIGVEGPGLDKEMKALAAQTGGGAFELPDSASLNAVFTRVLDELHRQYALGFTAGTLDGSTHAIEVRVTRPGVTVRARKSYVARPPR